jgi:hypothetical protein
MSTQYVLRSETQYELLAALCLIEQSRHYAEAAQQLSFEVLQQLLPTLKHNLDILKSIKLKEHYCDFFAMNVCFSLKTAIISYDRLINVIERSNSNESLYDNFCKENSQSTLEDLCSLYNKIWVNYWKRFHIDEDKISFLKRLESELTKVYSNVCLKGNENLPDKFRCLGCLKNSGYLKTGRTDVCGSEKEDKGCSLNYCYHFIDTNNESKYFNINRAIFERRMNEIGTVQQ